MINYARLAEELRYCPNCDPKAENPIRCAPTICSCGYNLCVFHAGYSGTLKDVGQYDGPRSREEYEMIRQYERDSLMLEPNYGEPGGIPKDGPLEAPLDDDIPF